MKPGELAADSTPPRKSRAGLVGLIAAIVIVLGGGAAAYYYLFYLPATPRAVLAEYLALQEKADYDGTYRFLSERSRKFFSPEDWKMIKQAEAPVRAQFSVDYSIGEPKRTGSKCRIPVTTKVTMKAPPPGSAAKAAPTPQTKTLPHILVKEKTGWKIALLEQSIEQSAESMREMGFSKEEIEKTTKAWEEMFKHPPSEAGR